LGCLLKFVNLIRVLLDRNTVTATDHSLQVCDARLQDGLKSNPFTITRRFLYHAQHFAIKTPSASAWVMSNRKGHIRAS
jgi:hypothetical protein